MKILDYIVSKVIDPNVDVLEIGSYHGLVTDTLYKNNINIFSSEIIEDAPIFQRPRNYIVYKLNYVDVLNLKHWDIVIANNVIHHLHSPYHFLDTVMKSCDQIIFSSCVHSSLTIHIPSNDYGPHSRRIVIPPKHYVSYLEEHNWTVNDFNLRIIDNLNRPSWLINATKNSWSTGSDSN